VDGVWRALSGARRRLRWFAARAAVLCAITAIQGCDSQRAQGWVISTTTWSDSGIPGHDVTSTTRGELLGAKLRVTSSGVGAAFGNYIILDSAASTITTVYPKGKLVLTSSWSKPARGASPLITMEAHMDSGYTVEDLGRGEPILGHTTHRYSETLGYELRVAAGSDTCRRHRRIVTELWVTPDTRVPDIEAATKRLSSLPTPMLGSDVTRILAEKRGEKIQGVLLKRTSTIHDSAGHGDPVVTHARWEVTEVKHALIDPADFRVPAGYKSEDIRKLAPRVDSSMRSAAALEAAKQVFRRMCGQGSA
jgi:hypothetical protein